MAATEVMSRTTHTAGAAIDHRCDRCGAGAKVRAVLASGGELLFCGHHARAHEDRLRQLAVALHSVAHPATGTHLATGSHPVTGIQRRRPPRR